MPIYIYECDTCGIHFERLQRFADQPLSVCPECGGHVRRIIQPVGIIFRGSGFYVTDNRQVSSPTLKPPKEGDDAAGKGADGSEAPKAPAAAEKEPKPAAEPAAPKPAEAAPAAT